MKLGYKEHAWDRPNLFVKTEFVNTELDNVVKIDMGLKKMKASVPYNWEFGIIEFVITEFVITEFRYMIF